jgi:hypothetical protein
MKAVIHKYTISSSLTISLPVFSKVLHVGVQDGEIRIWVIKPADPNVEHVSKTYSIRGTGLEFETDDAGTHLGSVFAGPFVWHVFERIEQ